MRMDFLEAVDPSASPVERPALLAALQQEKFRVADERQKERRATEGDARDDLQSTIGVLLFTELDRIEEAELRVRVERHEQALVEALIANEEALAIAQRDMDRMLGEAYVLPDGRRIFKTEDGQRVFDEYGQELGADEISPDAIENERPRWEKFSDVAENRNALVDERGELLEYQQKLDRAKDHMAAGTMSADDVSDLDQLMRDDVPDAVRRHLPPSDPAFLNDDQEASLSDPEAGQSRVFAVAEPTRDDGFTFG